MMFFSPHVRVSCYVELDTVSLSFFLKHSAVVSKWLYMHVLSKSFTWYPSKLNAVMILRRSHSTAIRPTQNKYIPIFCGKMRHRHDIVIITLTEYILRIHTASFYPSVL